MYAVGTSLRVTLDNDEVYEVIITGNNQYGVATRYRKNGTIAEQYSGYILYLEVGQRPIVNLANIGRMRLQQTCTAIEWL